MQANTIWWILAGLTIAAELLTGSIYLLMISAGMVAGAIAAHLGVGWTGQIVTAALVGTFSIFLGRRIRSVRGPRLPAAANPDLNLDIGEIVHVTEWSSDGSARIPYRGSTWTAVLRPGALPASGSFRIVEIHGNRLVLDKA